MILHEQPVLYSVDLSGCRAMSALAPETVTAAFVTALQSAGATVVPRAVAAFHERHPDVELSMREAEPESMLPNCTEASATTGATALRSACFTSTVRTGRPLACAVRM